MANYDGQVVINTKLDDKGLKRGLEGLHGMTVNTLKKTSRAVGISMAAATAAIGAFSVSSVNYFVEFEDKMNEVFTLIPNASKQMKDSMIADTKALAKEMGVMPDEIVPAIYQAISAGIPAENVFDFVKDSTKLAKAGVAELDDSVGVLSTIVNNYASQGLDAEKASNMLFTAVKLGVTSVPELASNLGKAVPIASNLGIRFNEVSAATAAMTAIMGKGSTPQAITNLRGMMNELGKEGSEVDKVFRKVARKGFREFIAAGGTMQEAIGMLTQYAEDNNTSIENLFGSIEAGQAALILGTVGADKFSNAIVEMENSAGASQKAFDQMSEGAKFSIGKIKATIATLKIDIAEKLAPAFDEFLSTAIKVGLSVPPVFTFMKASVVAVMDKIGEALDGPWDKLKGFVDDLLNMPVVKNTIDLAIDLAGDLWEGLKKGTSTGDWSDFWKAAIGVAQFVIGIGATISAVSMSASGLFTVIQGALLKISGFSAVSSGSSLIAMISIGLAVIEAMQSGDWDGLATNLIAALTTALVAGGLSKSATAGALAFTVALNFKLGDILFGKNFFSTLWTKIFPDKDAQLIMEQAVKQNISDPFQIGINEMLDKTATMDITKKWDWPKNKAYALLTGTEIGRQFVAGLGLSEEEIKQFAEDNANVVIQTWLKMFDINSPSGVTEYMGKMMVEGFENGLEGMPDAGKEGAQGFLDEVQDTLGVHSESKEGHRIGNEFVNGLINGLVELMPELEGQAEELRNVLTTIWDDQPESPKPSGSGGGGGGGGSSTPAPSFGSQFKGVFTDIKAGWVEAKAEMTAEIADWTGWAKNQFLSIGPAFGNAMGAGMRSLGQSISTQKETIKDLGNSIKDIQDYLTDAQDDLKDAQDDYNDAVLSGDKDAIKEAKKRVTQQEKLIKGLEKQETALKEEKKSVEDGSKAWSDFGKTVLGALADTLYGLGAELAARAALAAVTWNWAGAAVAAAGSAAAFGAAIAVDAWAGSFAEGGIVPQLPGVPSSGDHHVANVDPGELILNAAQQDRIASQLAMFARLTDMISSLQLSSRGGITINMAGATINGLNEEKVGRAIYRNIKGLQHEGVLKPW